ncbi:MAG: RNA 2',3'-cyclic phosphodiesterase [Acidobacteria bacterium]|nr:RNA 2',3'-cyclic phosphodiesterase [Acidobacteriota bacterium]
MRLFIGIPVPEEIALALSHIADPVASHARRVPPENMHITLSFLGEVQEEKLAGIIDELTELHHAPFNITLTRLATFPGVFHAEVQPSPALLQLHEDVIARMDRCGFSPEQRRYHAHITLARSRDRFRGASQIPFQPLQFTADTVVLYRSHLGGSGARYQHLHRVPLTSGSS